MNRLCANPFVVVNFYTIWDYIYIGCVSVFALLRLVIFSSFMIISGVSGHLIHFIKDIHNPKDYTLWKKYYIFLPIFFIRCALYALGFFKISIDDRSNSCKTNEPVIQLLIPHSSIIDYFAVCFLGLPSFVARSQTKENWIISKLVSLGNAITVDRNDKHSRKRTVDLIKQHANTERVLLFPEGTNTNREMMIKFKLGAFIPALPVQPVFIKYPKHHIDSYSWAWEGPSASLGFFLTCCKPYSTLSLIKLPVYYPNEEEEKNPSLFAQNVQKYIERECDIKFSHYVYDDSQYLGLAEQLKIPRSPIGIKLLKICDKVLQLKLLNYEYRRKHFLIKNDIQTVLEDIMRYFIKNLSYMKLKEIRTGKDILMAFNLYEQYPSLEASSIVQEFLTTLSGFSKRNELITSKHLAMAIILCNIRQANTWHRIHDLIIYVNEIKSDLRHKTNLPNSSLSINEYKFFIWCLLGLESYLLDFTHVKDVPITYDYLKTNFVKNFERAVNENASSLIHDRN